MIVALALGLALGIQAFLIKPYQIPSGSMEPTLNVDQRVLVNRFIYHFTSPKIGDIVVFHPPVTGEENYPGVVCPAEPDNIGKGEPCPRNDDREGDTNFIKRIVAGPGDTLSIRNGHPVVNGKIAQEGFINPCASGSACTLPKTIKIPPGHYFMMGDNRGQSDDSRFWGPVPQSWFIGKAFFSYWKPSEIGFL